MSCLEKSDVELSLRLDLDQKSMDSFLAEDHAPLGCLERRGIAARWSGAAALGHIAAEKADEGINGLALQRPMHLV